MMTYVTIETFHQTKYLQLFAMNILLFIFYSLSFYFISLIMMLNLIFDEHFFKKKKTKNKRHMSLKFY